MARRHYRTRVGRGTYTPNHKNTSSRRKVNLLHIHHHHYYCNLYQSSYNINTNTIVSTLPHNNNDDYNNNNNDQQQQQGRKDLLGLILDILYQLLVRVFELIIITIPLMMSTISNSNHQNNNNNANNNSKNNSYKNHHHSTSSSSSPSTTFTGYSTPTLVSPKYYYPPTTIKAKHLIGRIKLSSSANSTANHHPLTNNYSHGIVAPQPLPSVTTESDEEKQQQGALLTFSAIFYKLLIFFISFLPLFIIEKLLTFFAWVQLELLKAKAKNINPDQTYSSLKKKRKAKKVKKLKTLNNIQKVSTPSFTNKIKSIPQNEHQQQQQQQQQSTSSNIIIEESNLSNEKLLEQPTLSVRPPSPSTIPTINHSVHTSSTSNTDLKSDMVILPEDNHNQNQLMVQNGSTNNNTTQGNCIQLSPSSSCSSLLMDHPELMLRNQHIHRLLHSPMSNNNLGSGSDHAASHIPTSLSVGEAMNNLELMGGRPRSDSLSMIVPESQLGGRTFAEIRRVNSEATLYQTSEESLLFEANQQSRREFEDFLRSVKDIKDVRNWLQNFSGSATRKIAIVKISRRILETQYGIDQAASSLCFMFKFGLLPIVIHGGLNDIARLPYDQVINERRIRSAALKEAIKKMGVGSTVLTPDICEIKPVVEESEIDGTQDSPSSDTLSEEELEFGKAGILPGGGLTMKIESFDYDLLTQALEKGKIPIWDSVAETTDGIEIPINSDITTFELAKLIQPFKIIFACNDGGILDVDHKAIPVVYLDQDYRTLLEADHTTERRRVQLKQMKRIVDNLPSETSVIVTSIEAIAQQILFPRLATGTIVKRREDNRVIVYDRNSFETVDFKRLRTLIEDSFGRALSEDYFDYLRDNLYALYLCVSADDQYMGCAIVTFKKPDYIPYLCKFCVQRSAQGLGLGDLIWRSLQRDIEQLYWRSRNNNPLNPWYFSRCQGSFRADEHFTVFWYGDDKFEDGSLMIEEALRKPITVLPNTSANPPPTTPTSATTPTSTTTPTTTTNPTEKKNQ